MLFYNEVCPVWNYVRVWLGLKQLSHVMKQPVYAYPRSLISTFVVRSLDGKIPLVSISEISSL